MTALALRTARRAPARFGMGVDLVALTDVLIELEHGAAADRFLDATIYQALGWEVECARITRRRVSWQVRSPWSRDWQAMPSPTGDLADAKRLVPHRWDWRVGRRAGLPHGFVSEGTVREGHDLPIFFEASRLTEERSLSTAALFAHRHIAMEAEGHA